MLANLVSLSLVALAVASAVPSDVRLAGRPVSVDVGSDVSYRTVSAQLRKSDKLYKGPYYYIRDGICNAILNTTYLCGDEELNSIEVVVVDSVPHASVQIQPSSKRVVVSRALPSSKYYGCAGKALVDLRLNCDLWKSSRSHSRLPLPHLLELDNELS